MRILTLLAALALAAVAVDLWSSSVRAQEVAPREADSSRETSDDEGTLIPIGPERGAGIDVQVEGLRDRRERRLGRRLGRQPGVVEAPTAVSSYWIGIGGGPLPPEVRAQLPIPSEEGVLIRTVAPESPAAEAGLTQYDVVLRANGRSVNDLAGLADIVGEQGEAKAPLTLDVLRRGEPVVVAVTPVERPVTELGVAPDRRGLFGPDGLRGLLAEDAFPFGGAPGAALGEGGLAGEELGAWMEALPQMAAGVSVSVSRQGDGPAIVTVRSGDQTWEFDAEDKEALAALPDDVRPVVERMLAQNGGVLPPGFEGFGVNGPGFQMQLNGAGLAERMRTLQERMQALQGQFGGGQFGEGQAVDPEAIEIEPQEGLDEAPPFDAGDDPKAEVEGPLELEIPATPDAE